MKKILTILTLSLFLFILSSCETSVPNGLEPLVAYEGCETPTLEGGWVCVWGDEFNGDVLDLNKWNIEENGFGGGNNELQYYRKENIEVKDGLLNIIAKKEYYLGKSYTSARINSKYKGDFTYGRVVIAAEVPNARGAWSALWMLPTMNEYGIWPNSGEIDIMEHVGYDPHEIHSSTHTTKFNHLNERGALTFSKTLYEATTDLNIYEMIWGPGRIQMFVNSQKIGEFNYAPAFNQEVLYDDVFPFDLDFHLILNLAIGGNWGGLYGIDDNAFPYAMQVDYVRVYQLDYASIDQETPTAPTNIQQASVLPKTLFWKPSDDDYGIEYYNVYVNGEFFKSTRLYQMNFYEVINVSSAVIEIEAVDFVGRVSPKSEPFTLII